MNNSTFKNIFLFFVIFIMIIITIFIYLLYNNNKKEVQNTKNKKQIYINNNDDKKTLWETKYVKKDKSQKTETLLFSETTAWNKKEIYKKFDIVNFNSSNYLSNNSRLEYQNLGDFIKRISVSAYNDENVEQIIIANIYEIKNISSKCAIAVNFENDMNYYIYINLYYTPNTLLDLVEDLNFKEIISISSISYNYKYFDENGKEQNENIEFVDIKKDDIWNKLFYDLSLENLCEEANLHREYIMTINSNISLLNSDIYINITNDGYLSINVLGTEKIFYIGNNKIQEFVNYVIDNYTGYKIVYINDIEDETTYPEDKILTIQNTLKH